MSTNETRKTADTAGQNRYTANDKVRFLCYMGALTAVILLMSFTPLGYLKVGLVEISFLAIPVVIGAIVLGPKAGIILGAVFGITSFIQCFGASAFGAALLQINPIFTFLICMIPRVFIGYFSGILYQTLKKHTHWTISHMLASLCGALTNTVLFTALLVILFGRTDFILDMQATLSANAGRDLNILGFAAAFVGINGLVEAITCAVVGTVVSKALTKIKW